LKLAAIQEPITYLLYRRAGSHDWLPYRPLHRGHPLPRTAGMKVFASGAVAGQAGQAFQRKRGDQFDFKWDKPDSQAPLSPDDMWLRCRLAWKREGLPDRGHQASANQLAQTAAKEYDFFTDSFGSPESSHLNVVELPDDTLPAVWAPRCGDSRSRVGDKSGSGCWPTPLCTSGLAQRLAAYAQRCLDYQRHGRYGELMYVEEENGKSAMHTALQDVAAGAGV